VSSHSVDVNYVESERLKGNHNDDRFLVCAFTALMHTDTTHKGDHLCWRRPCVCL